MSMGDLALITLSANVSEEAKKKEEEEKETKKKEEEASPVVSDPAGPFGLRIRAPGRCSRTAGSGPTSVGAGGGNPWAADA